MHLYVLDTHCQPTLVGVSGELYVSRVGMIVGGPYWSSEYHPVEAPKDSNGQHGTAGYRTGQRARRRADQNLELLIPEDQQITHAGHHIERELVAASLMAYGLVREAFVDTQTDNQGQTQLVAYIVLRNREALPTIDELQQPLKTRLPLAMVPSQVIVLDELPLTSAGDIDQLALLHVSPRHTFARAANRDAWTPTEATLVSICKEIFGNDYIDINDNLFDLGCDSLLATRLLSHIRNLFHADLTLRSLFEAPIIRMLADRIDRTSPIEQGRSLPPLVAVPREYGMPLSFAQQRLWYLDRMDPGNPTYNIPGAVRIHGTLQIEALREAFSQLIGRHEDLANQIRLCERSAGTNYCPTWIIAATDSRSDRPLCGRARERSTPRVRGGAEHPF